MSVFTEHGIVFIQNLLNSFFFLLFPVIFWLVLSVYFIQLVQISHWSFDFIGLLWFKLFL